METAFNVLMVVLALGFAGGIVFSVFRVRGGRSLLPDMRFSDHSSERRSS